MEDIWEAFIYLSPYRELGMGLGLIKPEAIRLYMETFGTDDVRRFWPYLRALDVAYVAAYYDDKVYVPDQSSIDDEALARQIKALFGKQKS